MAGVEGISDVDSAIRWQWYGKPRRRQGKEEVATATARAATRGGGLVAVDGAAINGARLWEAAATMEEG
ncbi:hypothetical protein GW17_00033314 [Ensete ventricosum]|nr:hypothetical protein GW17_00033314 [Ensete ventricosum]